jgi:hypothetical protein
MGEPATTIDTRFSEPGSVATPWSQTRGVLEAAETEQKAVNLRANPHVVMATGCGRSRYQVRDGRFYQPPGGDAQVYSVTPAKVLAFGKGRFTHTSHRF